MNRLAIARIAALLLPLTVLGWQVFSLERNLADHTLWRIPIEGFDPRDMIRGQYVRYAYRWPVNATEQANCEQELDNCRLCLAGDGSNVAQASVIFGAAAAPQCEAVVRARQPGGDGSVFGPQRYYLDERHARAFQEALGPPGVDDLPPVELEVAVTRDGALFARRVFIDGEPYPPQAPPVTQP